MTLDKLDYPADFVKRIKARWPKDKRLHKLLNSGSQVVGYWLDQYSIGDITNEDIVMCIDKGKVKQLRDRAARIIVNHALALEWQEIYRAHRRALQGVDETRKVHQTRPPRR